MRKRYYIFFVTHDWDGQLRRVPIPVKWVVLFVAFAVVGAGTVLGLAGSYTRMLTKVQSFDELRSRQDLLLQQLMRSRQDANQFQAEVASLGSLASEVSALYNFKHNANFKERLRDAVASDASDVTSRDAGNGIGDGNPDALSLYSDTLNNFQVLETSALANSLPNQGSLFGPPEWQPDMWPVRGRITSSFGERTDPFNGEGAFHEGLDISVDYNTPIHVTGSGVVIFAGIVTGYGRTVIVDHGHAIRTLYAHMASFAVTTGQRLDRNEVVGYVGDSGRATGPHLHYEIRINQAAVNPYRYLHP